MSLGRIAVRHSLSGARAVALIVVFAGCTAMPGMRAPTPDYEIWAMDQGTHTVHIFNSGLEQVATIDLGAQGARVPHMLEFTSDHRYAFVASPATGNVTVIRASDRAVVAQIPTGPRTHHAAVAPGDRTVLVSVIGTAT